MTPSAKAVEIPPPATGRYLEPEQVQALANREVQCQKAESDLSLTTAAYDKCLANASSAGAWWANPTIVVGGVVIGVGVGAIVALALKR
jgi:hypothetical protein